MLHEKTIGKVRLTYLSQKKDTSYSDGPVEKEFLKLFKSKDADQKRLEILRNNPSWEYIYHLSPQRGAIVSWYNFKSGSDVLEIGAGCGAITEELIKHPINVTSLELTERRSLINAYRNSKAENLNILVGNLTDYKKAEKFDYIVCIGVFEYSGSFVKNDYPYDAFLEILYKKLKPGGKLILAIENQLGLKYWAGAREDHTGKFFDGLNQYPNKKVKTFGRLELENILIKNKYNSSVFYYPFPDYKHPQIIYSDDYYPGNGADFPLQMFPTPVPGQKRVELFSEGLAMMSIERNKLFPHFSNSFLVEATK